MPHESWQGLQQAKEVVPWQGIGPKQSKVKVKRKTIRHIETQIYASVGTSFNYVANTHTHVDFCSAMLTVSVKLCENEQRVFGERKQKYAMEMPVACHFVFPEMGVSVGLIPRDHLLFNPQAHHDLSMRMMQYCSENVFATAFYLKIKIVGGNNNALRLTNLQKAYVMEMKK